jgi:hypothetical protein
MSNEKKEEKLYRVHDVHIDRSTLKDIKSLDELKKTEIFVHLDPAAQDKAYAKLWADLKPEETAKSLAPGAAKA